MDSSKGICFSRPKSRKRKTEMMNERFDEYLRFYDPPAKTAVLRHKLYLREWRRVESDVKNLEDRWYNGFTNDVVEFVKTSSAKLSGEEFDIPLAFLITGLSSDENSRLFNSILESIRSRVNTHLIAKLSSQLCPNLKLGFENIFKQLMQCDENANADITSLDSDSNGDSEDDLDNTIKKKSTKRENRNSSVYGLTKWYNDLFPDFKNRLDPNYGNVESKPVQCESPETENLVPSRRSCSESLKSHVSPKKRSKLGEELVLISPRKRDIMDDSRNKNGLKKQKDPFSGIRVREKYKSPAKVTPLSKPIIIAIKAVDFFQRSLIKDLLQLLSCSKLPIILLVGVTHGLDNMEQIVPGSSIFRYKCFTATKAGERLDDFMDEVVFNLRSPVRLSGSIVKYLSDAFLYQDFSITRLKQAYQVCLLHHFRSGKSALTSRDVSTMDDDLVKLSAEGLKSLQNYSGTRSKNVKKIIEPSIENVRSGLDVYRKLIVNYFAAIHLLSIIAADLPESPLGKNRRDLYSLAWDGSIFESSTEGDMRSPFQKVETLMRQFSPVEMSTRLDKGVEVLNKFYADNMVGKREWTFDTNVYEVKNQIEEFKKRLKVALEEQQTSTLTPQVRSSPRKPVFDGEPMTALQHKEALKGLIERSKKKHATPYENLRVEIVKFFTGYAKENLKRISTIPFNEVFVFADLESLKSKISVNMHSSIHKTLPSGPNDLNEEEKDSPEFVSTSTSVLYDLFMEGDTMKTINLNDSFKSFKVQMSGLGLAQFKSSVPSTSRRKSVTPEIDEDDLLSQFRHSVAELQFLGFLKPSNSNAFPDEYIRLTWNFSY